MRILKRVVQFLILLLVLLSAAAFLLPGSVHVERTIVIDRPASEVFGVVNSFKLFNAWSPWVGKDPNAKYLVEGPVSGVGAKISWTGNSDVGRGSQTIIQSDWKQSDKLVRTALDFGGMGKASADFLLSPSTNGSQVRWTLDMDLPLALDKNIMPNLLGRYMGLFMDKMVGPDYEHGLLNLKSLLESLPNADITGVHGELIELAARKVLFVSSRSSADLSAISIALTAAYNQIGSYARNNNIVVAGTPLSITTSNDASGWQFDAAIPVDRNDGPLDPQVKAGSTYAGRAVQFSNIGAYDKLAESVTQAYAWLAVHGYQPSDRLIEQYVDDPATTPIQTLHTLIQIPVK